MMRVLYAYRYGIVGGVSTQLRLRRSALAGSGHECELFFSQDNGLGKLLDDREGIHFGSDIGFARLVRKGRFDAVIVIDSPELLAPAAGSMFRRNPVYLDVHTTTATGLAYLVEVKPSRLAGVMVPTRYSEGLVKQRLPVDMPIAVVPNILNTDVFSPVSSQSHGTVERLTREFVWVGKLDHHKNWRLALVYTAMLRDLFGDVRLHVVGGYTAPADQAEAFFRLAYRLGISECVSWLDRVENASLARLYHQCAHSGGAMLVTSRDESFGMAAAEALLCGCPLIANDLPVFREVFPDSPMIQRVDIWDPEQVADAAGRLQAPPEAGEVDSLYRELSDRYGPRRFVQSFETLLSK
jgi:glycosyltransferase involved in cell wall biosynthesis